MNKIILITTKGCIGCDVMRNSISKALTLTKKDIIFEEKDIEKVDKRTKARLQLTDFPTTLFYSNNKRLRKEIGSKPYIVVLRWIDIDFK